MTGFFVALCQIFAAYLIFKYTIRKMTQWDNRDQENRLKQEADRAKQLSDAVLKQIDISRLKQPKEDQELQDLLLIDAMNREARAKASLIAVLREHGCTQAQIDEVIARIDNQQHAL